MLLKAKGLASGHREAAQFVQSLSNPLYLHHLAVEKYLDKAEFVAYLAYLQYFRQPRYPGPTLRALDLLQQDRFRKAILMPETLQRMINEGFRAGAQAGA
ncbi:Mediator of RNA polymerase II transcription subunit 31 [Elasticomyces elasticus]|nr:Mediator of RNA polymerase II transcription subunit 31 [Elasticomyces elasticus]